jgi:hypothetical protein
MIIESIVLTKVVLATKGAAVAAAHQGVTVHLAQNFVSTALSSGLVPALHGLISTLAGIGALTGVVLALKSLLSALEDGDLDKIFSAISRLTTAMTELGN